MSNLGLIEQCIAITYWLSSILILMLQKCIRKWSLISSAIIADWYYIIVNQFFIIFWNETFTYSIFLYNKIFFQQFLKNGMLFTKAQNESGTNYKFTQYLLLRLSNIHDYWITTKTLLYVQYCMCPSKLCTEKYQQIWCYQGWTKCFLLQEQIVKGCRMGRSVSLWYVALLIDTRFRFFILE